MKPPDVLVFDSKASVLQAKRERSADNYIELMNWAFVNHDEYLYNRAVSAMVRLLKNK
jgi:hypothetical protein